MTIRHLDKIFTAASVALLGASNREGSIGATVARNLLGGGFAGDIWFVNPKRQAIEGRDVFGSVDDLPGVPDLAVIATPPETVPDLIEALGARGTRAAIVLTAGLGEGEGSLKERMLAAAVRHQLRIVGSNCLGVLAPRAGLNASFAHCDALAGDLALISQSGAIVTSVLDWASSRGIGFSHVVSMGNMDDVDVGDLLDYLAGDVASRAILLYLEGIRDARGFMSAARSAARVKPVVVIKAGRGAGAARAAASHTGAMAGSDAVYDAAFERAGLLRVYELDELFDAAEVLSRTRPSAGDRLSIVTNGGGAGILAVEQLEHVGGKVATLAPETIARLDAALPPTWSHSDPVDIVGDAGSDRYIAALDAVLDDKDSDAVLLMYCPTSLQRGEDVARAILGRLREEKPAKPVLTCWLGEDTAEPARRLFGEAGLPTFATPGRAVRGFSHVYRYSKAQKALMRTPPDISADLSIDRAGARAVIESVLAEGRTVMHEDEAKRLLAAYGIPVAHVGFASDPAAVGREAEALLGELGPDGRLVLKIVSPEISHKSDVGGVRLDILDASEAVAVAEAMVARVARARPDARITGFAVEPMIRRPNAAELILGLADDPTFGPVVLFGAGGTAVEVMNDKALALPPLDMNLAASMMGRTRVHRLLRGYRDRPAADCDAIGRALVGLSQLAADFPEVRELDINPLLADENGVIALDARAVVEPQDEALRRDGNRRFAIRPYPTGLEGTATLQGGRVVRIRPVRPEDERFYDRFFAALTPRDIRLRLFAPVKSLTHGFIARLTQIDYARAMAFMAFDENETELLGVSRLAGDPDYEHAEYAIIVRSDLKGLGLGWLLMQRLIDHARAEDLKSLHGDVMTENTNMLNMCRHLGFTVTADPADPGICQVSLEL